LSFKLERTRQRGVYRSSGKYVVPYWDELGSERRREFGTLTEARDFRTAVKIVERNRGAERHVSEHYVGGAGEGGDAGGGI
jgi:hypothetical protein